MAIGDRLTDEDRTNLEAARARGASISDPETRLTEDQFQQIEVMLGTNLSTIDFGHPPQFELVADPVGGPLPCEVTFTVTDKGETPADSWVFHPNGYGFNPKITDPPPWVYTYVNSGARTVMAEAFNEYGRDEETILIDTYWGP
jgi:PKD repeat protein